MPPQNSRRGSSDQSQTISNSPQQRPVLDSRSSSFTEAGIGKLDSSRELHGSIGRQTLMEEDEDPAATSSNRQRSRPRPNDEEPLKTPLAEVTIAIVGEDNAGKTSFIQCALDMKHPPSSYSTKKKMSLDGSVYLVRLLEIDLRKVKYDQSRRILWPRIGKDSVAPRIDGVLLLHDGTEAANFETTLDLVDSLEASLLPFLLVACKCDLRPEDSELVTIHDQREIYRTSPDLPRSQQMCIALVLRAVISYRDGLSSPNPPSNLNSPPAPPPPRTTTKSFQPTPALDWHHTRANSETPSFATGAAGGSISTGVDRSADGNGSHRSPPDRAPASNLAQQHATSSSRYARSNSQPARPQTPTASRLNSQQPSTGDPSPEQGDILQPLMRTVWRNSASSDAFNSFLNMDDEIDDGTILHPDNVVRPKPSSESSSSTETGVTFDELVDRLIAIPMTKQDQKFSSIFLCLYRKFAAPSTLLTAMIGRFEKTENSTSDQLARMQNQLRLLDTISEWAAEYPGDFAFPKTRKKINDFVASLEKSHFYMFAAKEIGSFLDSQAEDDDVGWAFRDGDVDESSLTETFFDNSGRSSPAHFLTGTYDDDEEEEDPIYSMNNLDLSDGHGPHDSSSRLSGTMSISSTAEKPVSTLNQSVTILTLEASQKEAFRLELTSRSFLTKIQWRFFMETPDEDFARQLTRIDWIMYNSFRPRDLVRHVSISGVDKSKIKSLQNVNRMIKQFNHIAFFTASMILLRDKPKHRAKCLEKFMSIAAKLRRHNNYNALGAVVAAINGTPIHRLTQTRELIPISTQREFMRLVILMGTQRSHFAYRLAWENSFAERIPFLPLHRRDLVSAEEGNKTFVGENKSRINWKKFEVMGEVVLGIQRSQKTAHPQAMRYEDLERLVLDTKLSGDEEDLYARSLQVEPSTGGEPARRKFGWLRA